jgi:RNA polymerase primary sigma factor
MRQLKITKQVTNRDLPSLDKYLQEIGREQLISPEDEVELARRIRKGDRIALEKMIKANLRFVVSVSKQYQNQGLTLSDLINEGNLGLIKAAQRFDETKGFKFISYAVWWIRQSILQALAEQSRLVRLPLNKIGSINKVNRAWSRLEQEMGRTPSCEEVAREMGLDVEEIKRVISSNNRPVSMDAPLVNGEEGDLYDQTANPDATVPDEDLLHDSLCKEIDRVLSYLNDREADILRLYFGLNGYLPLSLDEIAEKFGLTRERVRQIKEKALNMLRSSSRKKILRKYLG